MPATPAGDPSAWRSFFEKINQRVRSGAYTGFIRFRNEFIALLSKQLPSKLAPKGSHLSAIWLFVSHGRREGSSD